MPRLFAIIPAAGLSRRMGRHKLLLPLGRGTVIDQLLGVLQSSGIAEIFVVMRKNDDALREVVERRGATVIQPNVDPPDMRTSVEHGLRAVAQRHSPTPADGWLLSPADHPLLEPRVLGQLVEAWACSNRPILLPTFEGQRGHPTFFRWALADSVFNLPPCAGINQLVRAHGDQMALIPVDSKAVLLDLDTPEDYERLLGDFNVQPSWPVTP